MDNDDFNKLAQTTREITQTYPESATFIGGMAVWAHCNQNNLSRYAAMTHDGDFVIGLEEFGDLKELEVISRNSRLDKHEFKKNDFSFDVYAQYQNSLSVPVEEIISQSEVLDGARLADLGHLLKLKAAAAIDRKQSAKGEKDKDDLVRILLCLANKPISANLARLDDEDYAIIQEAIKGEACVRLCAGNLFEAKKMRSTVQDVWKAIVKANDPDGYGI